MDPRDNPTNENRAPALASLLRWYTAMGVDAAVDEAPHDRFVAAPTPSQFARVSSAPAETVFANASPTRPDPGPTVRLRSAEVLVAEAEALAAGAVDLADLEARWRAVPGCTLATSSRLISSHVLTSAEIMLIGGTPGEDDERDGALFAGAAGRLLDAMLRSIGLNRADISLAHVVPWRPPGNRSPTPLELRLCLPFCRRQIELAAPRILVCLGERAAQPLLAARDPLSRLRGRWLAYEGRTTTVKTLTTFAPGFLLIQPLQKRRVWADLLMIEAELDTASPRPR